MALPKKLQTFRISEDGQPGPTHYSGPCPKCGAQLQGVLPAAMPKKEIECPGCHVKLTLEHVEHAG